MKSFAGVMTCDSCGGRLREAPEVNLNAPEYARFRRAVREGKSVGLRLNAVRRCTSCDQVQLSFFRGF